MVKARATDTTKRTPPPPVSAADIGFLRLLQKAGTANRKKLLRLATGHQLRLLSECCLNFLQQTYSTSPKNIKKLRKHKAAIRSLARRRTSLKHRRNVAIQKGGFLPLLLPAAISFLANLISR